MQCQSMHLVARIYHFGLPRTCVVSWWFWRVAVNYLSIICFFLSCVVLPSIILTICIWNCNPQPLHMMILRNWCLGMCLTCKFSSCSCAIWGTLRDGWGCAFCAWISIEAWLVYWMCYVCLLVSWDHQQYSWFSIGIIWTVYTVKCFC